MAQGSNTQIANRADKGRNGGQAQRASKTPVPAPNTQPGQQDRIPPLWVAFIFIVATALFSLIPRISDNARLAMSFRATAGVLLALLLMLRAQVSRTGRKLSYEFKPRSVHYVQLVMHSCVYAYWGWYWREVYRAIPLIVGQIVFAYALDMIVNWFRRDEYVLGFGPFPIILSTNLFLWFHDDYFYWQFVLIAVGVLGKEFIKWKRDGRMTHIFNPSALSLFIFSVVLVATRNSGLTWGIQIARTFHNPPQIFLELFLLGLVVQGLFGVTLVTLSAAASLYIVNQIYTHVTGVYLFVDAGIPVAVFLGLLLLVTDPATSPRRNFGKIIFGALYGIGVSIACAALSWFGAPEFYDKLLCVPILNLFVQRLDRLSDALGAKVHEIGGAWKLGPRATNFACMGVWISLFAVMSGTGFLTKGSDFPGGRVEFWQTACEQHKWESCKIWTRVLNSMCESGSRDACFKYGLVENDNGYVPRDAVAAGEAFGRACDMGLPQGCGGLVLFMQKDGQEIFTRACYDGHGASCYILGEAYSNGRMGARPDGGQAFTLFEKSCSLGFWRGCVGLALSYLGGQGTAANPAKAIEIFDQSCNGGDAASCYQVASLYARGVGGIQDTETAMRRLQRACELGLTAACGLAPRIHQPRNAATMR